VEASRIGYVAGLHMFSLQPLVVVIPPGASFCQRGGSKYNTGGGVAETAPGAKITLRNGNRRQAASSVRSRATDSTSLNVAGSLTPWSARECPGVDLSMLADH
jgi:hypothetical protein